MKVLIACEFSGVVRDAFIFEGKSFNESPLPQWIDVIPRIKIAWEAAAHDVLIKCESNR